MGQDIVVVLFGHALWQSEMAKELATAKEANSQLEEEVVWLKEATVSDKKALTKARKRVKVIEEKVKATELERGALSFTLATTASLLKKGQRLALISAPCWENSALTFLLSRLWRIAMRKPSSSLSSRPCQALLRKVVGLLRSLALRPP